MATARLLKDFNYYFLVILAAPFSHSKKGTILGGTEKIPPISCVPKDHFWKKNFYYFWVQTSTVKHIYSRQTTTNNSNRKNKRFHHYNSISFCLFEYSLRFSLTLSHRENFSFKAPLKYKRNKKRTTFKRSSSHKTKKNIYKKYTRNTRVKKCGESILKEEEKKVTNTIHSRKSKHSLTLNTHSHQHNAIS